VTARFNTALSAMTFGGVLARFGRAVEDLVDRFAQRGELDVESHRYRRRFRRHHRATSGSVLRRLVHLGAGAVGVPAVFIVEFGALFRIDGGRSEHDVGGEAALGM